MSEADRDVKLNSLGDRIELEKVNKERLEAAARDKLVADVPFDPVEQAKREGRYVSPEHIKLLIEGYVAKETPFSKFSPKNDGTFRLDIDQNFLQVLFSAGRELNLNQIEQHSLQRALTDRRIKVMFDLELASDSNIELVAPGHWLVRAICKALEDRPNAFHPVSAVVLNTDLVPKGIYVYGLFLVELSGPKEKRLFEPVFISLNDGLTLPASKSQELLSKLLISSKS